MLDNELVSIFGSISETMLGTDVYVLSLWRGAFDEHAVRARVEFSGGFSGTLTATFTEPLARAVTSLVMQQSFEQSTEEDVCDTLGELVNIVAGNLKSVLPGSCQLSLPSVQVGGQLVPIQAAASLGRAQLRLLGEPLCVELFGHVQLSPSP